jgi:hypothetical protein
LADDLLEHALKALHLGCQLLWVLAEVLHMFTVYYELFYKLILYCYVVIFICEDLASFCHCVFHVINSYGHLFHNFWRCNCIFCRSSEAVFLTTCIKGFLFQFHMLSLVRRWTSSWCDLQNAWKPISLEIHWIGISL